MVVPDGEWEAVGRDAHAVMDEAKAAGVYVFSGGIDEDVPPALVSADGTVAMGGYPWAPTLDGGFTVVELLRATRPSRGRRASPRPIGATKSCASSGSTHSPKGDTEENLGSYLRPLEQKTGEGLTPMSTPNSARLE